ncbi:hypothetical protein D3C80_2228880 [compost metagenome]
MPGGRAWKQRLAPLDVVGKATGRQHHRLAGMNGDRAADSVDHGATDPALFMHQ